MEPTANGHAPAQASQPPAAAPDASNTQPERAGAASGATVLRLPAAVFLLAAVVCGGIFVLVSTAVFPIFIPPTELLQPFPPPEVAVAREASLSRCRMLNSTIAMGGLALLVAVVLSVSEAGARRFGSGTLLRLVPGVALALALGCGGALLGHLVTEQTVSMKSDLPLVRTFLAQMTLLVLFGAGVGACVGLVAGGIRTGAAVAVLGVASGFMAAMLFSVASSLLMPRSQTEHLIPGGLLWGAKDLSIFALWVGLLMVALGLLLPFANREVTRSRPADK